MKLKNLLPTLAIVLVVLMTGCKKEEVASGAIPEVTSTNPSKDATNVPLNKKLTASFSEKMNHSTLSPSTFILKQGARVIEGIVSYNDTVAIFEPSAFLIANTTYTATLTTLVKSITGMALENEVEWSFTTAPIAPPTVYSTHPENNATHVALDRVISVTFSDVMDVATINNSTFKLKQGETVIPGVIEYSGTIASFTPSNNLISDAVYEVSLNTGIKNLSGIALTDEIKFTFTAGIIGSPFVTSTDPDNLATNIALNQAIKVSFSEPMNSATLNAATFTVFQGLIPVAGTITYSNLTATFTPAAELISGESYKVIITSGATNAIGISMDSSYEWTFTTVIIPASTIISTDPANLAVDVNLDNTINATFSDAMDASTFTAATFTLYQELIPIAGTVSYSGTTATFTPTENLLSGTLYTAKITTGVKNALGIAMESDNEWTFTTLSAVLPTVLTTYPLNDAMDVDPNTSVTANFSVAMDATTINATTFTVFEGSNPVAGTVSYTGTVATFIPTAIFADETLFTAIITTGAKDLAGNALLFEKVWIFRTGVTTSPLAVVDLGAAGNYVVLAKTAINNTPTSNITGDIAVSPAAASLITGFSLVAATGYAESEQVTGQIFAADMADPTPGDLTTAVENMITAYNDAAGRVTPDFDELLTGNIGGQTLTPGLYKWTNTVTIPSDITISGGPNDVWIFQIAGDLSMASAVNVTLEGGAQAKNIFWQVAGQATFGATSHFEGIVLSMTDISLQTGATMNGRALAQAKVVLDANILVQP